jgi:S-adenosylmethionine/arginine decarboxylase-like enzyme
MRRPHELADREFTFGVELVMDIDDCTLEVISDPRALQRYTAELVDRIKMKAYGPTWLHHFGHARIVTAGYTAFQPIEDSSIVVHVSEGLCRVHVNVFSCREFDPFDAMDFTEKYFGGTDTTYTILPR